MTGFQAFATGTAELLDLDPYRFPAMLMDDEPEETSMARGVMEFGDYVLPAPEPESRLAFPLAPSDRRRLELHATLTAAGIAPLPGDLDAIEALCGLDDTIHVALLRWINPSL
ncbi:hypothetical protein M5362_00125 [Streptomyces sp. Je 1-79]|uniref:hypothetical protein n=1 Tax=Streptomyces sp. Je 1-79 TaxID=2943847 RepID=UPI0021A8E061|nr:hypothetical protein [Streptomyces sp. Je 1-79]MCT4351538.1 hypothetical protein [Streptomyces sp. Je 1-79]